MGKEGIHQQRRATEGKIGVQPELVWRPGLEEKMNGRLVSGLFKGEVSGELGGEGTRTKVKSIGWDCWIL